MPRVSEFLNSVLLMSGVDPANEKLKLLLSDEKFQDLDIDEELSKKVSENLMTKDAALNNGEINKTIIGKAFGSMDVAHKRDLTSILPQDKVDELYKIENTSDRTSKAFTAIADHLKKQPAPENEDAKKAQDKNKELSDMINDLNKQISNHPTEIDKVINDLRSEFAQKEITFKIGSMSSPYKYAEQFDHNFINYHITKTLNDSSFIIKSDMKLYQKEHPDLIAQKDNKDYTTKEFIEETISPYLQKHESPNNKPTNGVSIVTSESEGKLRPGQTGYNIQEKMGATKHGIIQKVNVSGKG